MLNVVLTNKPNRRELLEKFIRSRGISNFIVITETIDIGSLLEDMMVSSDDTFNLHVFDFYGDLSIVNTIRDYRDQINMLRVYVASVEDSQAYLTLTDDVFIMPITYDILMYFWDSEACKAKNVAAFDLMHMNFFKINIPESLGKTDQLAININTQQIPLKYKTASGTIVETQGPQIVVSCKAKSKEVRSLFNTRNQEEVYNHHVRNLADLPTEVADISEPKVEAEPVIKKAEKNTTKPVKDPKQVEQGKGSSDKHQSGLSAFFMKFKLRDDETRELLPIPEESLPVEPETTEPLVEKVEQEVAAIVKTEVISELEAEITSKPELKTYIGFSNVKSGTQVASGRASAKRFALTEVYDSVSRYCMEKKYISAEDGVTLQREVANKPARDALFGNLALSRGLLTEEQLIDAVTQVNHVEILTWNRIAEMELDFTYFSRDKCSEFKFFKIKDKSVEDTAQIVCAFSLSSIHPEVRRLFDNPRILYTLDSYITRKLEES